MTMDSSTEEIDLITEVLEIERGASKSEIKKAYHKAALSSHPDKVAESERAGAEIKFKSVSKAYEILYDDDKRHLYDTHGMLAFDSAHGNGMGAGPDLEEMLSQMFGMGSGMPPGFGGPGPRSKRGDDEEHPYQVTLEDLYKGKTTKFASTKNVICSHCKGSGGKEKAKAKQCASCQGKGSKQGLRSIGPGMVTQETVICASCQGKGSIYAQKDRCKKCKGVRVTEARKVLEIYIPRGSKEGDKIVLEGEADQVPDQEPGDIIFGLVQTEHETFRRAGADLLAEIEITLAESLCGFSRVVLKHLDGRGLHIQHPQPRARVLKPGQVIKLVGEGMPHKKSESKGDLYLEIKVKFPEYGWLEEKQVLAKLKELLPTPGIPIEADVVDDVTYDETASLDEFGASAEGDTGWVDDDEEIEPQCAQQ
ncbi:MAG: hypothetical protein ASARMPRED_008834 [Alectoria sarmentosa]|nr:MAG: hypothetical protein ASARMPRED_008834 [Alectoria sarmentosa]